MDAIHVPENCTGLRLCKLAGDNLRMTEEVQFVEGRDAVAMVLRRAAICGKVGPVGEAGNYWADFLNKDGNWDDTVALDRESWNSLKNHWMRCKMWKAE